MRNENSTRMRHDVPAVDDPAWRCVDPAVAATIAETARRLHAEPAVLPTAGEWREFRLTGNRTHYERRLTVLQDRLTSAALSAALAADEEQKSFWAHTAADDAWILCEMTTWCLPAHHRGGTGSNNRELPVPSDPFLDLDTGVTGALLAWAGKMLAQRWGESCPTVVERVHEEIRLRVLTPFTTLKHWWFGSKDAPPNNWAPWIVSNVMACALVVGTPQEQAESAAIAARIMEYFRMGHGPDGACEEGATYWWVAALAHYEALVFIDAATGEDSSVLGSPLVAAMGRYPYQMQIHKQWQTTYGDGSAQTGPTVRYHTALRYARDVGDADAALYARSMGCLHGQRTPERWELPSPSGRNFHRIAMELLDDTWIDAALPSSDADMPYPATTYLPSTGVLCARENAGASTGLYLSIKGADNGVRHNHNDVGSFTVFLDGNPVVIDVGVESYRRQTFDDAVRYSIWTMRSKFHNVPLINGHEQRPGCDFAATEVSAHGADAAHNAPRSGLSMNLAGAYGPVKGLDSWHRSASLDRSHGLVEVVDSWHGDDVRPELILMLASEPARISVTAFAAGDAVIEHSPGWEASFEAIEVNDVLLVPIWGHVIYRAVLRPHAERPVPAEHRLAVRRRQSA